ncbi:MAG: hypothetical protein MUE44_19990 [Oscillatoriaceae cyanobacterium Prado104]|nr:hypothetical protein [Oscillatoriaceae cyanobacterium Prado104]
MTVTQPSPQGDFNRSTSLLPTVFKTPDRPSHPTFRQGRSHLHSHHPSPNLWHSIVHTNMKNSAVKQGIN